MRFPRLAPLLVGTVALAALAAEPLRLRFRTGQRMRLRVSSVTLQSLKRGDTTYGSRSRLTQEVLRVVDEVDGEGAAWTTNHYQTILCVLESGSKRIEFDGSRPEDAAKAVEPSLARYAGLQGRSFRLRIGVNGRALEVRGFTEIGRSIAATLDPDHPDTPSVRESLMSHTTDGMVLRRLQATSEVLPADPIEPDDTWTKTGILPNPAVGDLVLEFTYRHAGTEELDGVACIHIVGEAEIRLPEHPSPGSRYAGGEVELEAGEYRHEVWLDRPGGFLRKAKEKVRLEIVGELPGAEPQTETVEQETEMIYLGDG